MSSLSSGGGGGAIYQDGEAFAVDIADQETTTVPDGETWLVTLADAGGLRVNNLDVNPAPPGSLVPLPSGDTIEGFGGDVRIRGWRL